MKFPFFAKRKKPEWQVSYQEEIPARLSVENEPEFIVVDIETTGFDVLRDRILSIAVARVFDGICEPGSMQEWIVFQENAELNEAVEIHGILPSESSQGQAEEEVLKELVPILTGSIMVGHHVRFDAAMIHAALMRNFGMGFRNRLLDTALLSMHELDAFKQSGYSRQKPPTLDEVCAQMGINTIDRHTAAGDVFTTVQLFMTLLAKTRHRMGEKFDWKDLPYVKL